MSANSTDMPRYSVAELFCGCGGFSHGFHASGRFDIVLGNDVKEAALHTFRLNHHGARGEPIALLGDIRQIEAREIVEVLDQKGIKPDELDCLIGGPPCQGFSQMRRSEERQGSNIVRFRGYDRLAHDPRNDLVLRFLEIAEALRPRFLVIENVPQMLRHGYNGVLGGLTEAIQEILETDMEYNVAVKKLNAADYGVPQLRERAFFIASRDGEASFPQPTHAPSHELTFTKNPWVTVRDALADLPSPMARKDKLGGGPLSLYREVDVSDYARSLRSNLAFPYNHITRSYEKRILEIIREMRQGETWDAASERMRARYEDLIEGERRPSDAREIVVERLTARGLINPVFYKTYYWSAYTRLAWDQPALTITANANFLGSGRFTHPEHDRGITMREAARLQSFNDDFRFITSSTNTEDTSRIGVGMDMIGEAVPPLLGRAIAEHIAALLDQQQ